MRADLALLAGQEGVENSVWGPCCRYKEHSGSFKCRALWKRNHDDYVLTPFNTIGNEDVLRTLGQGERTQSE
jgi:hypothetical protein